MSELSTIDDELDILELLEVELALGPVKGRLLGFSDESSWLILPNQPGLPVWMMREHADTNVFTFSQAGTPNWVACSGVRAAERFVVETILDGLHKESLQK